MLRLRTGTCSRSAGSVRAESPLARFAPDSRWILPRTERRVSRPIRELTGWNEACLAEAISEQEAFRLLDTKCVISAAASAQPQAPSDSHFARFELPFLRDLYERHAPDSAFPLDVVCMHQIATRLFRICRAETFAPWLATSVIHLTCYGVPQVTWKPARSFGESSSTFGYAGNRALGRARAMGRSAR